MRLNALPEGSRLLILAPLVRGRKGTHQGVLDEIQKAGFVRARVDGKVYELEEEIQMDRYKIHTIEAVVDRIINRHTDNEEDNQAFRSRLTDSIETALKFGEGYLTVQLLSSQPAARAWKVKSFRDQDIYFSEHLSCPVHGVSLPEIEPRTFSFNTPHGACPDCQGLGGKLEIDPGLLIPDPDLSLNEGAIAISEWNGPRDEGGYYWQTMEAVARQYHIDLNAPVRTLSESKMDMVLYGTRGEEVTVHYQNRDGRRATFPHPI
jgi:excinuclease ABC subunit A